MTTPLLLVLAAAGLVLMWSAIYGANITATARDFLAGRTHLPDVTS